MYILLPASGRVPIVGRRDGMRVSGYPFEGLEAQQGEPVGMGVPGEDLLRAFTDALGTLAAQEAAMVEEEAQEIQVVVPQLFSEEEVVSQATVKVLHNGAGTSGVG